MKIQSVITITLLLANIIGSQAAGSQRTWVFFADKGCHSEEELRQALKHEEDRLLPATKDRLLKVRPPEALLTEVDLPVYPAYLKEIERLTGLKPHAVSRALNAASYAFAEDQIALIGALAFVKETRPVRRFSAKREPPPEDTPVKQGYRSVQDSLFYGGSYLQNALENFPPAHDAGYTGQGVLVGMLDAGWNNLAHTCFDSLEIVATWDFVNGDSSVADDPGQPESGTHGTKTLSCLAGYDPENMIGTAYGVSVALAKTENTLYELHIEEDNWAAGIEWLDSLGCVIASSSVSYCEFDSGGSYSYPDLDGNTTIVTIAADNAVARGVVVVNSMGNDGAQGYPNHKMNAPSDGDSVLSIGAVSSDSSRASFSSIGPTYDGRIKPDLMALGVSARVASPYNTVSYTNSSGTSFSAPITAGACALLLQADPALTPMQVHTFLKATGDQAFLPDTLRGWGIYDVWQAIQNALAYAPDRDLVLHPTNFQLLAPYPNPFNGEVTIPFSLPTAGEVSIRLFSPSGRLIYQISTWHSSGYHDHRHEFGFLPSGIYLCKVAALGSESTVTILHLK